jgi:hypothetical protein
MKNKFEFFFFSPRIVVFEHRFLNHYLDLKLINYGKNKFFLIKNSILNFFFNLRKFAQYLIWEIPQQVEKLIFIKKIKFLFF